MKKIWLIPLLIFSATWILGGLSVTTATAGLKAPEEEMIITGVKKKARFSHPVHLNIGLDCAQCHHDSDKQPLSADAIGAMDDPKQLSCASCHNENFANPELQSIKDAFHARCKECHKQGVNGKQGPTKCTDCHVK